MRCWIISMPEPEVVIITPEQPLNMDYGCFFFHLLVLKYRHQHLGHSMYFTSPSRIKFKEQNRSWLSHNYVWHTLIMSIVEPLTMQGDWFDPTPGFKCMTNWGGLSVPGKNHHYKPPIRSAGHRMCQLTVSQLYEGVTFLPACRSIRILQIFLLTRVRLLWRRRAMIFIHLSQTGTLWTITIKIKVQVIFVDLKISLRISHFFFSFSTLQFSWCVCVQYSTAGKFMHSNCTNIVLVSVWFQVEQGTFQKWDVNVNSASFHFILSVSWAHNCEFCWSRYKMKRLLVLSEP